jgi:predicted RNase H-like HicB family nuclease
VVRQFKIIVEKHTDGYVAYPLGLKGIVVGEGQTYEEALADVKSAIAFHIETFDDAQSPADQGINPAHDPHTGRHNKGRVLERV